MDGKPMLLDKIRHQTKHSYLFAIVPLTGRFWRVAACHEGQLRPKPASRD